jgi:hypothetical protein
VEEANPEHSTLTRDVDLLVRRSDLEQIKRAAEKQGIRLIYGDARPAKNAVRLILTDLTAPIAPERKHIYGKEVKVIPLATGIAYTFAAWTPPASSLARSN